MEIRHHPLPTFSAGTRRELRSLHFGQCGSGRKAYIQAALHADEVPAMLVAQYLREEFAALDAARQIRGEIVLVPMANPIGLSQDLQGSHFGRFDLSTGINFNRGYQHLSPALIARIAAKLGADAARNTASIRTEALALLDERIPQTETDALKLLLQRLAIDADIVLDLHCDHQAVLHLYCGTALADAVRPLAARLGAQALLTCAASGDDPFDEAVARHWWELAEHFKDRHPIAPACLAATVELRGEVDVDVELACRDAIAIVDFLRDRGHIEGQAIAAPRPRCRPTPLEGVEPLLAPCSGIVVFHRSPGELVLAGDRVAEIVDPHTDQRTPIVASVEGLLFARVARRWATRGMRLAKIAGAVPFRSGKLLSM